MIFGEANSSSTLYVLIERCKEYVMRRFHMVFDRSMITKIRDLSENSKQGFSKTVRNLLCAGLPALGKRILEKGDVDSKWLPVGETVCEKNVFVEDHTYRQLKKLHVVCNFFSMAQIVRLVLLFTLALIEEYGFEMAVEILEKEKEKVKKTGLVHVPSRCRNTLMDMIDTVKVIFNKAYIPLWVEFP